MSGDSPPDFSGSPPALSPLVPLSRGERLLAGVQAGVAAFFVVVSWLGLVSRLDGRSFWTIPNLMAGLFYGVASLRPEFAAFTLSGLALELLLCVGVAIIASQMIPPRFTILSSLAIGVLLAAMWFYLWDGFFWRFAFPPFAVYSKRPSIFFGHVLIGLCIGLYSIFVRSNRTLENRI
jgi:hypothetical protein